MPGHAGERLGLGEAIRPLRFAGYGSVREIETGAYVRMTDSLDFAREPRRKGGVRSALRHENIFNRNDKRMQGSDLAQGSKSIALGGISRLNGSLTVPRHLPRMQDEMLCANLGGNLDRCFRHRKVAAEIGAGVHEVDADRAVRRIAQPAVCDSLSLPPQLRGKDAPAGDQIHREKGQLHKLQPKPRRLIEIPP